MPVSPQDYALWAAATGNKYPSTVEEKARLAPEVYDFNRGFGKFQGFNSFEGFQNDIVYDQPQSVRHYGDNSLLQSPITPDNNVPKVAGQLNNTLTGRHYTQNYADDATATGFGGTSQPTPLLQKAALGALGVGALAAGAYGVSKATGTDIGVGKVGGMLRNLGSRAKSGLKSALGLADEAAGPSFVTRQAVDETLATAQQGISAIDDVAPGIVREQNVVPINIRATQQAKSRIPDPWGESALGQAGQTMSAPAMQSVVPTQTGVAGVDPDIAERVAQFIGVERKTPIPSAATQRYGEIVREGGGVKKTTLSGIDPQTRKPFTTVVPQSALLGNKQQLFVPDETFTGYGPPKERFAGYGTQPLIDVPGKVGTASLISPVPQPPSVLGSFPGSEGSSATGVRYTALQGEVGGRPYRYSVLPAAAPDTGESVAEFLQRIDTPEGLGGLLAPQRPLPEGALSGVQRSFSTDPRAATVQKQAEAIFQATGDPSVIRGAYGEAASMPIRVVLPSGESIPTSSLYTPFGLRTQRVPDPITGKLVYSNIPQKTPRSEELQAFLNAQSQLKEAALAELGLPVTYQPSQEDLSKLSPRTKEKLINIDKQVASARNRLEQAEASQLKYKLKPEITEGVREVPVVSETSGQVVGSRVVPEMEGLPTSEYHKMRAAGGAGRQETGGIGRSREALESMEGLGFTVPQGSIDDVSPVLYQVIDDATGQAVVVTPNEVSPMQILSGAAKPVRGTAVEPQRIMGTEGRTFKGVAANVIDPGSFDPAILEEIAKSAPERIDPTTGLAYSVQAMGGKQRAAMAGEQEALRQAGRYKESIQLGKKMAETQSPRVIPGAQEGTMFTNMSNEQLNETVLQARNAGMLDVEQAASNVLEAREAQKLGGEMFKQRQEMVKQALSGTSNFPVAQQTKVVPGTGEYRQRSGVTTRKPTARERAFRLYSQLVGDPAAMM